MSDIPIGDPGKPLEQPNDDLSDAIKQSSEATNKISSSSKNLSDMPFDVVGLITEKCEYKEQLILRKVSKTLRALVDKQKPSCKMIKVELFIQNVIITFNNHFVMYTDDKDMFVGNAEGTEIMVRRDDFMKVAFDDLASTLKNPKLQLEELIFRFSNAEKKDIKRFFNEIQKVLESLNHQLSVKQVELIVFRPSTLHSILLYLKPRVLEKIKLQICFGRGGDWMLDSNGMDQVALLEQWKQAEELELDDCFDNFPMEYATHFKRFHIFEAVIDIDTFDRIKEFLSKLDDFEYFRITHFCENDIDDVQKMTGIPVPPNMSHYSIPDLDSCLEFCIDSYDITIVEKICHLH